MLRISQPGFRVLQPYPLPCLLFVTVDYSPPRQIVGRKLHQYLVAGEDPDKIFAHFSRHVSKNQVFVFQLHPEHCIRERFYDRPDNFYCILFRHIHYLRLMFLSLPSRLSIVNSSGS
jgi:hypothetical protein